MISYLSRSASARSHEGFGIDSLQTIPNEEIQQVFEASNNKMNIMGAVRIEVELEGGRHSKVALHVAKADEEEILLGTNALPGLGVRLSQWETKQTRRTSPVIGVKQR